MSFPSHHFYCRQSAAIALALRRAGMVTATGGGGSVSSPITAIILMQISDRDEIQEDPPSGPYPAIMDFDHPLMRGEMISTIALSAVLTFF
jgi:hypothetical protein